MMFKSYVFFLFSIYFSTAVLGQYDPTNRDAHPDPKIIDMGLLTDQIHVAHSKDGETEETPLHKRDINNNPPEIINPALELTYTYDRDRKALVISREIGGKVTNEHIIGNLEITSNIAVDGNLLVFATKQGFRAIMMDQLVKTVFRQPLLAPLIAPSLPKVEGGQVTISKIGFEDPFESDEPINEITRAGDIRIEVKLEKNGETEHKRLAISSKETLLALRSGFTKALVMMAIYNDDRELLFKVMEILKSRDADQLKALDEINVADIEESNPLVRQTLANLAHSKGSATLLSWLTPKGEQDALEALAADARHTYSAEDHRRLQEILVSVKADESLSGTKTRDAALEKLEALNENANDSSKPQMSALRKLWQKYATKRNVSILSTALLAGVDQMATGGQWRNFLGQNFMHAFDQSTNLPGIGQITGPIKSSLGYFDSLWAGAKWAKGAVGVLALYPLSLGAGKLVKLKTSKGQTLWQTFFDFGVGWYARICYPLQKVIFDIARQKNLYPAMINDVNPLTNSSAWNMPFASNRTIQNRSDALSDSLQNDSLKQAYSRLIAAAIVAHVENSDGDDHFIDVATLVNSLEHPDLDQINDVLSTDAGRGKWDKAQEGVYALLATMTESDLTSITPKDLTPFLREFREIANNVQNVSTQSTHGFLSRMISKGKSIVTKGVLPFVLFGKQGYEVFNRWKNATVDKETSEIAGEAYRDDYTFSAVFYASAAAAKFGSLGELGLDGAEVAANQSSQVFIYGVQGAVDPLSAATSQGLALPDNYRPFSIDTITMKHTTQQSFLEATKAILNTNEGPGFLANHAQYQVNTIEGFQVRFAADYAARLIGMTIKTLQGGGALNMGALMVTTAKLSSFFLLAKISVLTGGIGYAVVWPYIHLMMRRVKNAANDSQRVLAIVDFLMETGLRINDQEMVKKGTNLLQQAYQLQNVVVPDRFQGEIDLNTARAFLQFRKTNPPLKTVANSKISRIANIGVGALLSTILFDGVSSVAYNLDTNSTQLLLGSLTAFGATYVGLKGAAWTLGKARDFVTKAFGKKTPDPIDPSSSLFSLKSACELALSGAK